MELKNATVLITGANRGIGLAFAREALARGARKVYAGVRDPASISLPGLQAIKLDVTSDEDVAAAAALAKDVTLVINNAGIAATGGFLADDSIESARRHLETNLLGPLRVAQAFAPVLAANGGGALLNVLSIASWINRPLLGVYGMSKSAAWALTNGLRHELREQGTQVLGLHMGFVDTDLTRGLDAPKSTPESVVRQAFDALEAGAEEVLADDATRQVKQGLAAEPPVYLQA
ncbi:MULTISPECIES: SDR family oxidoreductase [Achromobacter]|jgi:NAD(P)-dependent dehydrogenase (short-subunit alcohol dehydrogenase family)|uniref:SDR family oxidoreductase n=1 Tax=Achromobacter TaxID=222 RepID=UPI0006C41914|nr:MULTISPECIES: SDR family oxidoreductase [Achromobacter]MCH1985682.1 SDR family oxidoreductase [Achromobacter xylosoxidans]MCH4578778.1 SDR family oxidoreductase [Achromobacter xylosoxidans]MCH4584888.1 SDR family oxidoreductase [Achromobacter xylosoxidans]OMG81996.1 short-chain dehydrogenase [Achromobacter xylosoxidans]PWY49162.1 short chain dehydrogenase [Achromobacter sp. RW408]